MFVLPLFLLGHLIFSIIRWVCIAVSPFEEFLSLEGFFKSSYFLLNPQTGRVSGSLEEWKHQAVSINIYFNSATLNDTFVNNLPTHITKSKTKKALRIFWKSSGITQNNQWMLRPAKILINLSFLREFCSVLYNQGEVFASISIIIGNWILVTLK